MNKPYPILLVFSFIGFSIMTQDSPSNIQLSRSTTFATTEPGISRSYSLNEFRICAVYISSDSMKTFLKELAEELGLSADLQNQTVFTFSNEQPSNTEYTLEGVFIGKEGGIRTYYWQKQRLLTVDLQSHNKKLSQNVISDITKRYFGLIEFSEFSLNQENVKQENKKVEVRTNHELGRGVFAKEDIKKGEFIGGLYGKFYEAPDAMSLPEEYRDHVMQCANNLWRGNKTSDEAVQYLNHSCDPNCGVQGLFDFVAMRDIKAGEELTTDYAMQDDSNWEVPGGKCLCGAKSCLGKILPYSNLLQEKKDDYQEYISHWILHKYNSCTCPK